MKFIDHNSPEKSLLKDTFNYLSYMDVWICSIVEGYIYEKVNITYEDCGVREEYTNRYNKYEGEFKQWNANDILIMHTHFKDGKEDGKEVSLNEYDEEKIECYYKGGKLDGEFNVYKREILDRRDYYKEDILYESISFFSDGKPHIHKYYNEKKELHGTYKEWFYTGQIYLEENYKNGVLDGEYKMWWGNGTLKFHLYYNEGNIKK
jgi:antitoxin component YwqK of YwqJK toxin-antitoxin module